MPEPKGKNNGGAFGGRSRGKYIQMSLSFLPSTSCQWYCLLGRGLGEVIPISQAPGHGTGQTVWLVHLEHEKHSMRRKTLNFIGFSCTYMLAVVTVLLCNLLMLKPASVLGISPVFVCGCLPATSSCVCWSPFSVCVPPSEIWYV